MLGLIDRDHNRMTWNSQAISQLSRTQIAQSRGFDLVSILLAVEPDLSHKN
jgi:hypothetical protein